MSPFELKFSQMILHTETNKRMYNWSFLFEVLHKPTLLPSTFNSALNVWIGALFILNEKNSISNLGHILCTFPQWCKFLHCDTRDPFVHSHTHYTLDGLDKIAQFHYGGKFAKIWNLLIRIHNHWKWEIVTSQNYGQLNFTLHCYVLPKFEYPLGI